MPQSFIFAVSLRKPPVEAQARVIGVLGLNKWGTIFYMFHPDCTGQGYCTEALRTFLVALFQTQEGRADVGVAILETNHKSRRVVEKCGFKLQYPVPGDHRELEDETETELRLALEELDLPCRPIVPSLSAEDEAILKGAATALVTKVVESTRPVKLINYYYDKPTP